MSGGQRLARFFTKRGHLVDLARTVREGLLRVADETPCCGAIVDLTFPDGDGLALLDTFHARRPAARTLMLAPTLDRHVVNRACILGAHFVITPMPAFVLRAFADQLSDAHGDAVGHVVIDVARRHNLTGAEIYLLMVAVRGVEQVDLPTRLELADSTVRARMRSVARKCGTRPFGDVVLAARNRAERLAGWTVVSAKARRNAQNQPAS